MAIIQALYRPGKFLIVALAAGCVLLWFAYLRDLSPVCTFPVLLRNVSGSSSSSSSDSDAADGRVRGGQSLPGLLPPLNGEADDQWLRSKIAKVTVATNLLNSPLIERALRTHQVQNDLHGYLHYVTENQVVSNLIENDPKKRPEGAWTKPAFMMSIIVAELVKPEEERLEWLFWFDADTVLLNPTTPLEIFLPDDSVPANVNTHLLMASNWDGLNSGVFALRVHPWSVSLLSAVLGYPVYKADALKTDRFRDQSAFQWLLVNLQSPIVKSSPLKGREFWAEVPIRWFNSLPVNNAFNKTGSWLFSNNMTEETFDKGTDEVYNDGKGGKVNRWKVMRGDMLVHFAGTNRVRESWMTPWLDRADALLPEWANTSTQHTLRDEARNFYERRAELLDIDRAKTKVVTVPGHAPITVGAGRKLPAPPKATPMVVPAKAPHEEPAPAEALSTAAAKPPGILPLAGGPNPGGIDPSHEAPAMALPAAAEPGDGDVLLVDTRPPPVPPVPPGGH